MPSSHNGRPGATVVGAFVDGWRRVLGAPAIVAGVAGLTLLATQTLGTAGDVASSSAAGASPIDGWWLEAWTASFGWTLWITSVVFDSVPPDPVVAIAALFYIVLWIFLAGGIVDRFARTRAIRAAAFFSACSAYFGRCLRLALIVGACYWAIFIWLHPRLVTPLWSQWTRDPTSESTALLSRVGLHVLFAAALMLVSLVADFAVVRAVVEDRRSMLGALVSSARFVRRRVWRVAGLYLLNIAVAVLLAALWMWADPPASWTPWLAFAVGQLHIVTRLAAKLAFMASQVAFFQEELAETHHTAPEPIWPERRY